MKDKIKKIILASGSPRRRELMMQIGIEFEVVTSHAPEEVTKTDPGEIVVELSMIKAKAVSELEGFYDATVIGADTIVYADGKVLGKPADKEQAKQMIKSLAGRTHQVYTGVTIRKDGRFASFYEKTDVSVYPMTDTEIENYVETGEPMDKAGAYGIQGRFAAFVKGIHGDYNNVVGLPVARVYQELRKAELI